MATTQIAVRLPDALLRQLDELVELGEASSRADAVRTALEHYVRITESRRIGRQIAAGYERHPVGEPDEWGNLDELADWGAASVLRDLDRQDDEADSGQW